ncbi:hypothetical protein GUJ93_ZPchr0010g11301 [Zizania palustris]|uniref:Uncharacterized protein n=1 Tax=Zizania palustris TaxID=103762 RepID=A0A8J5WFT6_ZIZPA|nr:hypothetical protein GUJ93_ZPchr0010g11301 [Zizania palustris]
MVSDSAAQSSPAPASLPLLSMDDIDPLFPFARPSHDASSSSPSLIGALDGDGGTPRSISQPQTPPATSLQTVNIRSHIPITLEIVSPNYPDRRPMCRPRVVHG